MDRLTRLIRERRRDILERWLERAAAGAGDLSRPELVDEMPEFLDALALEVCPSETTGDEIEGVARGHGRQRHRLGFDVHALVHEYGSMRDVILEMLWDEGPVERGDVERLVEAVTGAIATSALEMVRERERERRAAEDRLRLALAQMSSTIEAAPAGIALLDTELRYVRLNAAIARQNGVSVQDHLGRSIHAVLAPELASVLEPQLRSVLSEHRIVAGFRFTGSREDDPGAVHHFRGDFFPVLLEDGELAGVGGVISDVTHEERAAQELQKALALQERLIGVVGHDLRTPLATISASARALERDAAGAKGARAAERITTAVRRMSRLIDQILDHARARAGGIPIRRRDADLCEVARATVEELEVVAPPDRIRLVCPPALGGRWDPDRLSQLLTNLVTNALQHGEPGTPVELRLVGEPGEIRIEVENRGRPIAADELPTLFEPFRRGREARGAGLGLGLYIVRQIAQAHGGQVEAAAVPGGTRFTVVLPRA